MTFEAAYHQPQPHNVPIAVVGQASQVRLVTAHGGTYRPGTPRQGWDHATGWTRRILADVWHLDLNVVQADFTNVGANPALDQFTDLARQLRHEAEEQARRHGRELGAAVTSAMAA